MLSMLEFVSLYKKSEATRRGYIQTLCIFFEMIYKIQTSKRNADHLSKIDELSIQYFSENRDYYRDLIKFSNHISKYSALTIRGHFSRLIRWMEVNDILFKNSQIEVIKRNFDFPEAVTQDHAVSIDEIRRWYEHLSRIGRTLLLMQLSSGLRIGELLALMPEDINSGVSPVEISVTKTRQNSGIFKRPKNNKSRITFISTEAAHSLREWMEYRDEWLKNAINKSHFKKDLADNRVFPVSLTTVREIYVLGLQKAGLLAVDKNSHRSTISSHSLRKCFLSQLKIAGMPDIIAEGLAGHTGYLGGAYDRVPIDQVRESYQTYEYAVSLSRGTDVQEMRDTKKALSRVESENTILHARLRETDDNYQAVRDDILDLRETVKRLIEEGLIDDKNL